MTGLLFFLGAAASAVCDDPQTQTDMTICAGKDYAAADEELNAQWAITAKHMKEYDNTLDRSHDTRPGYFETLLKAQRAWLSYRDAHCTSAGYYARGGSLEPLLVSSCKAELTRERTAQLRELAETN
ncbi:MAG: lysozyme inhibitor LprI family protein [Sphingobium sp.]